MSGPPLYDWVGKYGLGSPAYSQELAAFNAMRDAFLQQPLQQTFQQSNPGAFQGLTQAQTQSTPVQSLSDPDLIGAARFWGIPEEVATQIPKEQLQAMIAQARSGTRPGEDTFMQRLQASPKMLLGIPAMFAVGAGEAVTGGLQRLPIVGETLSHMKLLHESDQWLRSLEEGIRAQTPESFQAALSGANVVGNVAALWYPATGAWAIAGKAGKMLPWVGNLVTSPLARAAAQGGATSVLLAGRGLFNSDDPYHQQALMDVALGAGLGIAGQAASQLLQHYGPFLQAAQQRVANLIGTPEVVAPTDLRGIFGQPYQGPRQAAPPSVVADAANVGVLQQILSDPAATQESKQSAQAVLQMLGERQATVQTPAVPPAPTMDMQLAQLRSRMAAGETVSPEDALRLRSQDAMSVVPTGSEWWNSLDINERAALVGRSPTANLSWEQLPDAVRQPLITEWSNRFRGVGLSFFPSPKPGITPDQVEGVASALSKQDQVITSPILNQAAAQPAIDETTVARAATASNPGGTNIVEGIADPASFAQNILASTQDLNVRFARRPGSFKLDALISDKPLTNEMVSEYETHGMFTSQRALMANGVEGEIIGLHGTMARVRPLYGGVEQFLPVSDLMPYASSPASFQSESLWQQFNAYADGRAQAVSDAMGGALSPERTLLLKQQNVAKYISDFFDESGITQPGDRSRITSFFNERFVDDFRALVPEETAWSVGVKQRAAAVVAASPETPLRRVDDLAQSKGFMAVPRGDGGFALVDGVQGTGAPAEIHFSNRDAAEEFLRRTNRSLPDVTPPSDVPIELAGELPRSSVHEPSLRSDRRPNAVVDAVDDVADTAEGGTLEGYKAQVRAVAQSGNWGRLEGVYNEALGRWRPTRARYLNLDADLKPLGIDLKMFSDMDDISVARDRRHNWQTPWHDRGTDVLDKFDLHQLVGGDVTEIAGIKGADARATEARARGFSPDQIKAVEDYRQLYRNIIPDLVQSGHDPMQILEDYVPNVKKRQSLGASGREAFSDPTLNPNFDFFADHARTGNLQFREMDARVLWNTYLNGLGFKMHMADVWQPVISKWNAIARMKLEDGSTPLKPLADIFLNWADIVRYGFKPGNDAVLNTAHAILNTLVPGVTKQEARMIFNQGLTMTHSALLGFRPDVMARDSIQLLLALPRVGGDLFGAMLGYARNPAQRKEMWDVAMKHAFVQLGMPRIAAPGLFEGQGLPPGALQTASETSTALQSAVSVPQAPVSARYQLAQKVAEYVHDAIPSGVRSIRDTPLDPLYFYTEQGERMRLFTGYAGYTRAQRALASYRAAGAQGSFDQLMGDSAARTFSPAVQDKFKQLVTAGMDEEAAGFMGRQLADATQFRYGTTELPEVARSTFGRIGMQMGNFSFQFYQYLMESLKNGTMADKAKFLTVLGGVTAALGAATRSTGWNFNKWQYWGSLTFTGGPWLQTLAKLTLGASAAGRVAAGNDSPSVQRDVGFLGEAGRDILQQVNPLGGLVRDVRGIQGVQNSPHPLAALGRLAITGEIGPGPDYRRDLAPIFGQTQTVVPFAGAPMPSGPPMPTSAPWSIQSPVTPQVPVAGQVGAYNPSAAAGGLGDADAAANGDPAARGRFAGDELQLLDAMRFVPSQVRWQALQNYRAQRAVTGQRSGPSRPQPAHPGAGSMF